MLGPLVLSPPQPGGEPNGAELLDEPIGQVFRLVPRTGRPAGILIHARDEFGIIQSQQNGVKAINDLLHEFVDFVIAHA